MNPEAGGKCRYEKAAPGLPSQSKILSALRY